MRRTFILFGALLAIAVAALGVGAGTRGADAQVAPSGPVAHAGGPYAGVAGVPVQFNGGSSIGFGLSYHWSFGDGTRTIGRTPVHTYEAPGVYTVQLIVIDAWGRSTNAVTTASIGVGVVTVPPGTGCVLTYAGPVCGVGAPVCTTLGLLPAFCANYWAGSLPVAVAGLGEVDLVRVLPTLLPSQIPAALVTLAPSQVSLALASITPAQRQVVVSAVSPHCPVWSTNPLCNVIYTYGYIQ
jgi:PKD repeat protein